ncbi:hypothetical protein CRG98_045090 [Punica granatum]|uniref:DUF4216 domain-containing protein n=1 Tax=Punica granatum TaxID=22663 RepID=A0A2I0HSI1_PUNGR|nr:hypothetical protein CRG98_045090 [Punica granatum]
MVRPTSDIGICKDDDTEIVEVKHGGRIGGDDPFIIARQARQVYYVPYLTQDRNRFQWFMKCIRIHFLHKSKPGLKWSHPYTILHDSRHPRHMGRTVLLDQLNTFAFRL